MRQKLLDCMAAEAHLWQANLQCVFRRTCKWRLHVMLNAIFLKTVALILQKVLNLLDVTGAVDWPYPPFLPKPLPFILPSHSPPQWNLSDSIWKFFLHNFFSSRATETFTSQKDCLLTVKYNWTRQQRLQGERERGKKAYKTISIQLPG